MQNTPNVKLLEIGSLLNSQEKMIMGLLKDAINNLSGSRSDKIIYACGGWVRDKLFFIDSQGDLIAKIINFKIMISLYQVPYLKISETHLKR